MRSVVLRAGDPPRVVLAGDEPPLAVARVAVGVVGRLAEDGHVARLLVPPHDPVVGDVAPEQAAARRRTTPGPRPSVAGRQPLDAGVADAILREAGIDDLDRGVGIAHGLVHGGGVYHPERAKLTPPGNGMVVRELIVDLDDASRRLAWSAAAVGSRHRTPRCRSSPRRRPLSARLDRRPAAQRGGRRHSHDDRTGRLDHETNPGGSPPRRLIDATSAGDPAPLHAQRMDPGTQGRDGR